MDQRRRPRFCTDQAVTVTALDSGEAPEQAMVRDASVAGLGLEMSRAILPGTGVKIVAEDALLLGEAIYCRKEAQHYFVGVRLEQVLCGLAELSRAVEEF